MSHSYQTYLSFPGSDLNLDCGLRDHEVRIKRNARIFTGMSRTSNLVFDQIECIIRDKLDLMRNVLPTDENKRIQRAWRVNNIDP